MKILECQILSNHLNFETTLSSCTYSPFLKLCLLFRSAVFLMEWCVQEMLPHTTTAVHLDCSFHKSAMCVGVQMSFELSLRRTGQTFKAYILCVNCALQMDIYKDRGGKSEKGEEEEKLKYMFHSFLIICASCCYTCVYSFAIRI